MANSPQELQARLQGLFAFVVTPFTEDNQINIDTYRAFLGDMLTHKPAALFVCGGTGEFVSLDLKEYRSLVKAAVEEARGRVPVVAGAGYGTRMAIEFVAAAEEAGADGVLVMPPYLLQAEQDGLFEHYRRIAESTKLGIIIYQRDNAILTPATVSRLARVPNIIGFKDGIGDMDRLHRIRHAIGDRLAFMSGMPTAEMSAAAFMGLGISSYSSAVFNFVPEISWAFFQALKAGDAQRTKHLVEAFYRPLSEMRDRKKGYAIALIKAGVRVMGRAVGPARPPLVNPSPEEEAELKSVIERGLAALRA
jgi:5-dehydro-4-deoxyglucarate dehydratase